MGTMKFRSYGELDCGGSCKVRQHFELRNRQGRPLPAGQSREKIPIGAGSSLRWKFLKRFRADLEALRPELRCLCTIGMVLDAWGVEFRRQRTDFCPRLCRRIAVWVGDTEGLWPGAGGIFGSRHGFMNAKSSPTPLKTLWRTQINPKWPAVALQSISHGWIRCITSTILKNRSKSQLRSYPATQAWERIFQSWIPNDGDGPQESTKLSRVFPQPLVRKVESDLRRLNRLKRCHVWWMEIRMRLDIMAILKFLKTEINPCDENIDVSCFWSRNCGNVQQNWLRILENFRNSIHGALEICTTFVMETLPNRFWPEIIGNVMFGTLKICTDQVEFYQFGIKPFRINKFCLIRLLLWSLRVSLSLGHENLWIPPPPFIGEVKFLLSKCPMDFIFYGIFIWGFGIIHCNGRTGTVNLRVWAKNSS